MTWVDALSKMKKASGKTTEAISAESGIPIGTLNKIFAGQTKDPKLETIKGIVYCLGCKLDDLYEVPQSEPQPPTLDERLNEFVNSLSPGQALLLAELAKRMLTPLEARAGAAKNSLK